MTKLELPPVDPDVTIELGPPDKLVEFKLRPVTNDIETKLAKHVDDLTTVLIDPDKTPEERFAARAEQLDIVLAATDPKTRAKPSKLVTDAYKDGKVTRAWLDTLIDRLGEAARPT